MTHNFLQTAPERETKRGNREGERKTEREEERGGGEATRTLHYALMPLGLARKLNSRSGSEIKVARRDATTEST